MIIDFHTHMFPDKIAARTIDFLSKTGGDMNPFTDGTWKGLKESTKQAGIDHSIVLPIATRPGQFHTINEFATHFQEGTLISFGSLHPESENYKEELRQIQDMGMKGIKLHPDYQDTYFNDIRYKRIISYATELGLIISVHAGQDPKCPDNIHCTPAMAEEVLNEVEPEKLVLAHMGGNELWSEVEERLVGRNVYFDTGVILDRMPQEQFLRMVREHGADRIVFGTDSPWADQKNVCRDFEGNAFGRGRTKSDFCWDSSKSYWDYNYTLIVNGSAVFDKR